MSRAVLTISLAVCLTLSIGCGTEEPGGSDGGGEQDSDCGLGDPNQFYPLVEGAWWYHQEKTLDTDDIWEYEDKIVYCCAEQELPRRQGGVGFPLVRETASTYSYRWQEIIDEGVVRHYDEKFNANGETVEITYYCPSKLRIPFGLGESTLQAEHDELVLEADGGALPQDCLDLVVDTDCGYDADAGSCQPAPLVTFQEEWELIDVDAEIDVPAGTFTATEFSTFDLVGPDTGEIKYWFWSKGVGKVMENSGDQSEEDEKLFDFCIPTGPDPSDPPVYPNIASKCPENQ